MTLTQCLDDEREGDEAEEDDVELVVACEDAPEALEPSEQPLHLIAAFVQLPVVRMHGPSAGTGVSGDVSRSCACGRSGVAADPGPSAGVDRAVRDLAAAVPPPVGIPDRVDPVEGPVVTLAETDTARRRLGTMLDAEHPLGAGLHVGRPLRYPVGSDPGWLGGCVVATPALVLKPRDRWIGRDAASRKAHLDRVVGLARFLIRPGLACRNLASMVLGLCLDRLADDYAARYGVAPLPVETFVGPAHGGISLRATNRIHVGMTAGRGQRSAAGRKYRRRGSGCIRWCATGGDAWGWPGRPCRCRPTGLAAAAGRGA